MLTTLYRIIFASFLRDGEKPSAVAIVELGDYHKDVRMLMDRLDIVYGATQNLEGSWYRPASNGYISTGVTVWMEMSTARRSLSVGDRIEILNGPDAGDIYSVEGVGFAPYTLVRPLGFSK